MSKSKKDVFLKRLPVVLIIQTYKNWRDDRTLRLGAGIAYYGVFAIVPMLTLIFGVAAIFFSSESVNAFLNESFLQVFSEQLESTIKSVEATAETESSSINFFSLTGILSITALIIGASFIFVAFQDALDAIWHTPVKLGWRKWMKRYALSYVVVVVTSLLLLFSLLITSFGAFVENNFPLEIEFIDFLTSLATKISVGALGVVFLSIFYKLLTKEKVSYKLILIGSFFTGMLVVLGTYLLGIYITNYAVTSIGGAIGGILLLLIWIYYEAQIVLVGAQFIKTLHLNRKKLPPLMR